MWLRARVIWPSPDRGASRAVGHLFDDVEFDAVHERVVSNGTCVGRSSTEGLEVCLAGASEVRVVDGGERNQFDRVNLNLPGFDSITATGLHLRPPPQAKRDRDLPGQYIWAQLPAELHETTLAASAQKELSPSWRLVSAACTSRGAAPDGALGSRGFDGDSTKLDDQPPVNSWWILARLLEETP